jgi:RND family efflux transporter MFP subunit
MIIFRKISFYFALIGLIGAIALVVRLRAREPVMPPPVPPPAKPSANSLAATGLVEARRENTKIGVPSPGLVTEVCVKVWQRVEAGQPLIKMDDRELRATLLVQEANVAVAEATKQRARDMRDRVRKLAAEHAISEEDLQIRNFDYLVAEAQAEAARAAVAQTHLLLDRLVVKSPIAATILQVNVRAGEYVSPVAVSPTPPIVLGNIDEVQIRADVDEQLAPRVKANQKAVGYLKGDSSHPIELRFVRIEPFVVPKTSLTGSSTERVDTRVLQVIYAFPNTTEQAIYVGQQMDVYIEETPVKPAETVKTTPSSKVAESNGR